MKTAEARNSCDTTTSLEVAIENELQNLLTAIDMVGEKGEAGKDQSDNFKFPSSENGVPTHNQSEACCDDKT